MSYSRSVKRVYSVLLMSETFISELILQQCQVTKVILKCKIKQVSILSIHKDEYKDTD